jgi:hypothetical protein
MEIWIATGNKKDLRRVHPFLRDFAVIDIKEVANSIGYPTSIGLDEHSIYILNQEIKKRLISLNSSRRFYRVLFIVEELREELPYLLLDMAIELGLRYEAVYMRKMEEFDLICKSY